MRVLCSGKQVDTEQATLAQPSFQLVVSLVQASLMNQKTGPTSSPTTIYPPQVPPPCYHSTRHLASRRVQNKADGATAGIGRVPTWSEFSLDLLFTLRVPPPPALPKMAASQGPHQGAPVQNCTFASFLTQVGHGCKRQGRAPDGRGGAGRVRVELVIGAVLPNLAKKDEAFRWNPKKRLGRDPGETKGDLRRLMPLTSLHSRSTKCRRMASAYPSTTLSFDLYCSLSHLGITAKKAKPNLGAWIR